MINKQCIGKDVEGGGQDLVLKQYTGICLERLRNTTRNISYNSQSPEQDLNPGHPEHEAVVLTTRPKCSVNNINNNNNNNNNNVFESIY
jgi:hypothetical protein